MPQLFYGQWVPQVSGTTENLNDVYAVTEDLVFAVGNNGTILKTTDGGTTWVQKTSGVIVNFQKVKFISANVGFIYGSNFNGSQVTLLKTEDSGNTWIALNLGLINKITGISNVGNLICYVNCIDNLDIPILKKTTDGGITFQTVCSNQIPYSNIQFINEQVGFAAIEDPGSGSYLSKTIDGGVSWNVILSQYTTSFFFINQDVGFVFCNSGLIKTTNSCLSYDVIANPPTSLYNLFAINENIVWGAPVACLLNGSPCNSTKTEILNNGQFLTELGQPLKSIYFANPTKGYAIFQNEIYKNTTGTMLSSNKIEKKESVFVFPNPTKNKINISFNESNQFSIDISDTQGKNIFSKSFINENDLSINTENFSKGIYFITITSDNKKHNQKLIIN